MDLLNKIKDKYLCCPTERLRETDSEPAQVCIQIQFNILQLCQSYSQPFVCSTFSHTFPKKSEQRHQQAPRNALKVKMHHFFLQSFLQCDLGTKTWWPSSNLCFCIFNADICITSIPQNGLLRVSPTVFCFHRFPKIILVYFRLSLALRHRHWAIFVMCFSFKTPHLRYLLVHIYRKQFLKCHIFLTFSMHLSDVSLKVLPFSHRVFLN